MEGLAKGISQLYQFNLGSNLLYTFDGGAVQRCESLESEFRKK